MRTRLRGALLDAMKARDSVAVSALRSALAAIENAEAINVADRPPAAVGDADFAASAVGLGAGDVARRTLTAAEVAGTVRAEVEDRLTAAADYERLGQLELAERLRAEADVLTRQLGGHPGTAACGTAG